MAYDVNEQTLLESITNSQFPDDAKQIIDALLNTGQPDAPKTVADIGAGDVAGPDVDVVQISQSGVYEVSGTPVTIINSNEAVQLTYTVGGSTYVIIAGDNDDTIIIRDGVELSRSRAVKASSENFGGAVFGGLGDDSISGGEGGDSISGGAGVDTIFCGAGDDTISGGSNFDDIETASAGSISIDANGHVIITPNQKVEVLDGGTGTDTLVLSGNQSSYTLLFGPQGTFIVDRRPGGEGVDQLQNMDRLDFDVELDVFKNEPMDLGRYGGINLSADDFKSFIELYVAYFNRAPDAVGLYFWGNAFSNGVTLEEMAALFAGQPETMAAFPSESSNADFVATVYLNVLGRIPDVEGERFWTNVLELNAVSKDQFILEVLKGAKAQVMEGQSDEFINQQQLDREFLSNKTDLGAYFAVHRGMSNVEHASVVMSLYDGTEDGLRAAVEATDTYFTSALDPFDGELLMPLVGVLENPFSDT